MEIFFNQCAKRSNCGLKLQECFIFLAKSWISIFCVLFPKNGVPRMLYLISATAKAIENSLDFDSIDEKKRKKTTVFNLLKIYSV